MTGIINMASDPFHALHNATNNKNIISTLSQQPKNAETSVSDNDYINFLNKLPYDIIHNIFSRLSQQDCLECMVVSTLWFQLIPQYATMLWRKIEITPSSEVNNTDGKAVSLCPRIIQCLGPHVQDIVLLRCSEEQVHSILSILSSCGCSPRTLEFYKCVIIQQPRFITGLRSISNQLKELTFTHHNYNMAFLKVMETCPKLTHFSYSVNSYAPPDVYDTEPPTMEYEHEMGSSHEQKVPGIVQPSPEPFNITYLCLNTVLHKDKRTAPILQRCPKLKCLVIANIEADSDFYKWPSERSIDLEMFYRWCPLLQYIECNSWGTHQQQQQQWIEYARQVEGGSSETSLVHYNRCRGGDKGLRELITREAAGYGASEIIPILKQHESTLQALSLGEGVSSMNRQTANPSDWSQLEQLTQLHHLSTFSCKYLQFNGRVLCGFLQQCPLLTDLTLWCMQEIPDELLMILQHRTCHLTRLDLGIQQHQVPSETAWRWFFSNNTTLKRLCLRWGTFVTDPVMEAIGSMKQLEELQLVHTAKWVTRMDALRGLTRLKRLELWTVKASLDSVLKDLYWLQEIQLVGCSEVSCHSLRALVDHSQGQLHTLRIQRCGMIQQRMLDLIENKLASHRQDEQDRRR
ncbi:hypothetical protein BDA99DRAFT_496392 [Phascolomyces articulosus]|uniref:F-box domain-containing protein n=1 Tax=Phascolomyces articulosus TaxID=60185 RepID=A0AAD5KA76_9FUNG|nr:hypothetical protein BDA99DRAFT_496392 [Phascolomyces articulosus]